MDRTDGFSVGQWTDGEKAGGREGRRGAREVINAHRGGRRAEGSQAQGSEAEETEREKRFLLGCSGEPLARARRSEALPLQSRAT